MSPTKAMLREDALRLDAGLHPRYLPSRGGHARSAALTPERRREIAQKAAAARWGKNRENNR